MIDVNDALEYHRRGRPGKIEVVPTKPFLTQEDLSRAYTPGVAEPCKRIHADREAVFEYTARGNLVAVVTNGTAVLGLGNIGALAGKPVLEGKANLFKRFADVDVFDLEIDSEDPEEIVTICQRLAPTFGGINLEDIKAPECFEIERTLQERVDIPVFHDDQHGTAIISSAALINAAELAGKSLDELRVVVLGAGAAGIASAELYTEIGVKRENLVLCDSQGVIHEGRERGMNRYKARFASRTPARSVAQALVGADAFFGFSVADTVTEEMLKPMAENPIIFALANPDPEIPFERARAARPDAIIATGRSDYPNQVNNVLGFPFIFRGALDCRARGVNTEMKIAAARALATLAREDVPDEVIRAYGGAEIRFGRDYIIPKPFDHRVLLWIAPAVAEAAMRTGIARRALDMEDYRAALEARLGKARALTHGIMLRARNARKRVVYPDGESERVIRAARIAQRDGVAKPILIGDRARIEAAMRHLEVSPTGITIVDPRTVENRSALAGELFALRSRKGMTLALAELRLQEPLYLASMLVQRGDADAMICGVVHQYADTLRPPLQVIGAREDVKTVAGLYLVIYKNDVYFLADTSVSIDPTAEELADIALLAAAEAERFSVVPRVAMLSFSNFGSVRHPNAEKVRRATAIIKSRAPGLEVDGEMTVDVAMSERQRQAFPFSSLKENANVLVFPNLEAGNIGYKLLRRVAGADVVGPIFMGLRKPVYAVEPGADASTIVTMTALAVLQCGA
jgi:malate dehydrogenase (oxaloacetate-decarboxylating)(NADP+)